MQKYFVTHFDFSLVHICKKIIFYVAWIPETSLLRIIDRGLRTKFSEKASKMFEPLGIWIDI